jgi:N utilization substance protein B
VGRQEAPAGPPESASGKERSSGRRGGTGGTAALARREARRIALEALFEAEFGQRTATVALERTLVDEPDEATRAHARELVAAVVRYRDLIDARIELSAERYPVVQLARMDRTLLRLAIGELLHCATTPARVAISEWVELARSYSGEPARRLLNGVLGRVVRETAGPAGDRTDGLPGGEQGGT